MPAPPGFACLQRTETAGGSAPRLPRLVESRTGHVGAALGSRTPDRRITSAIHLANYGGYQEFHAREFSPIEHLARRNYSLRYDMRHRREPTWGIYDHPLGVSHRGLVLQPHSASMNNVLTALHSAAWLTSAQLCVDTRTTGSNPDYGWMRSRSIWVGCTR